MKKFFAVVFVLCMLSLCAYAAFEKVNSYDNNFSDVAPQSWYAENVKTAFEIGLMNGKTGDKFDPDGNVTVIEGITMASRLHAEYYGNEIKKKTEDEIEYRFDFDDPSILIDLTVRNSRNDKGINFFRSKGEIKDGMIILQADGLNGHGSYDPGLQFEGLDLDTRIYNKITFRMKRDALPNPNPDAERKETVEIFFETSANPSITGSKCVTASLSHIDDLTEWFEVSVDMTKHKDYTDFLKGLRFDTTNNNGIYYIDYIVFSNNGKDNTSNWYDMYFDYAVDNGIVGKHTYYAKDFSRNITRSELCCLIASALPGEHFELVNDIKGIPDVKYDEANADIYLMLYKAGVLLGSDKEGTFNGSSNIRRCEVAAIINRAALPENRVRGSVSADWSEHYSDIDLDFEKEKFSESLYAEAADGEIVNGMLILKAHDRGEKISARFDPRIVVKGVDIDTEKYIKMRVRMKTDFNVEVEAPKYDFYYMTEGDTNFSEAKSIHSTYGTYTMTTGGWYVFDIDLRLCPLWDGRITAFRFDPGNSDGTYTIDYIRFIEGDYEVYKTHEELIEAGYTATRLLQDEGFETGFQVSRVKNTASSQQLGYFQDYVENETKPLWNISPHWSRYDLIDDRDMTTGKYTIADKHGVNSITYNPEEKSLTMSVNTYPVYEGKPHINDDKSTPDVDEGNYEWWPHLLVSQASSHCPIDKKKNSAAADRVFVEIDIRLLDFKDTTIKEGATSANFMSYFYLRTDKAPGDLIWFGLNFFNGPRVDGSTKCGWAPDSAAHQYMYKMSQAIVFGGVENSFVPQNGVVLTGEEWKHVRYDVTPYIEQAVEWANRDNIFGVPVTVEDMYFEGVNIGYETWGSYEYTVEFKNFNIVSYNKSEK